MFVVSPHLDDAVLGIGLQMAERPGGTCVTLLAGSPDRYPKLRDRPHDEICGFGGAADPMANRRAEDAEAMRLLEWNEPIHLAFLDAQYLWPAKRDTLLERQAALRALRDVYDAVGSPGEVWTVAGLGHEDHWWTRDVVAEMADHAGALLRVWFEPGYRSKFAMERDRKAQRCGPLTHYMLAPEEMFEKIEYVSAYASQLHGISGMALRDALLAEVTGTWSR